MSRGEVLADVGLTDQPIARQITAWVAALGSVAAEAEVSERFDWSGTRPTSSSTAGPRGCSKHTSAPLSARNVAMVFPNSGPQVFAQVMAAEQIRDGAPTACQCGRRRVQPSVNAGLTNRGT